MAEITGLKEVLDNLKSIGENAKKVLSQAVYESALEVERFSRDMTPYDTGVLEGSHITGKPEFTADDVLCAITVGGPAAPYAVYVHENLDAFHKYGQAKFLELAVLTSREEYFNHVAQRFTEYLKEHGA